MQARVWPARIMNGLPSGFRSRVSVGAGMGRHTLTMVACSVPLRNSFSVYSPRWPSLSIWMLPTIVLSGCLTETPDQL